MAVLLLCRTEGGQWCLSYCGRLTMAPRSQAVLLFLIWHIGRSTLEGMRLVSFRWMLVQLYKKGYIVGYSVGKYQRTSGLMPNTPLFLSATFVSLHGDFLFKFLTFILESAGWCHLFKGGLTFIFGNWELLNYLEERLAAMFDCWLKSY